MNTVEENTLYAINPDWFEQNGMSFPNVVAKRLCLSCQKQLASGEADPQQLIKAISDCCSKEKDFIYPQQPIVESLFRLFLAYKNTPMNAEQILAGLNLYRPESPVSVTAETLQRLLGKTRYLGLGPVSGQ